MDGFLCHRHPDLYRMAAEGVGHLERIVAAAPRFDHRQRAAGRGTLPRHIVKQPDAPLILPDGPDSILLIVHAQVPVVRSQGLGLVVGLHPVRCFCFRLRGLGRTELSVFPCRLRRVCSVSRPSVSPVSRILPSWILLIQVLPCLYRRRASRFGLIGFRVLPLDGITRPFRLVGHRIIDSLRCDHSPVRQPDLTVRRHRGSVLQKQSVGRNPGHLIVRQNHEGPMNNLVFPGNYGSRREQD